MLYCILMFGAKFGLKRVLMVGNLDVSIDVANMN